MEEQIFELARALRERGGLLLPVFSSQPTQRVHDQYVHEGLQVEGLNLHEFSIASVRCLLRLVREHRITIIHWNFYSPINPYVWFLSVFAPGLQHFRTDHGSRTLPLEAPAPWPKRLVQKLVLSRYRKVFGISDFVVAALAQARVWTNVSRCNYFVNTDRFVPRPEERNSARSRFAAGVNFVVLLVGQLIPEKGADVGIRALSHLPESVVLWIVGDGPQRSELSTLASSLSVAHRVQFFGAQWNVEPYMQAADCLICPSVWGEAVGLVNMEALATGLPVIASRVGGIPEYVRDGLTGFLVAPGDPAPLAERIERLRSSPALAKQYAEHARHDAVDRFSIDRRIPEYVRAYES
ncbi:MAG: putative Glycosyl transferase group 1 [Gemmatimonadetes bacterium]|nr:putative Glycosyl transferase group 1 [Gemmatimonadota bacterium]